LLGSASLSSTVSPFAVTVLEPRKMASPLRIVHVIESLGHGGAEQNLLSLLRRLPEPAYWHELVWLYDDNRLLEAFRPHVQSLVPLHVGARWQLPAAVARLTAHLRATRPHVVHVQLIRAQLVARLAAMLSATGLPVVTTWQNAFYDDNARHDFGGSEARRQVVRLLDRLSGWRDSRFVAVSEFVATDGQRALGVTPDRVRVIYNCVEPDRYRPVDPATLARTRQELGLTDDDQLLLSVGRLVTQKMQRVAIEAMPAILERHPRAHLLIAGRGPMDAELRHTTERLGVGHRVRLLGARSDIAVLYQLTDVFVFPSCFEGLSVALLEALSNGLPAAISDIPQNREVADGFAAVRFAPVGSSEQLSRGVIELLDGGAAMRQRARAEARAVQERFSPERLGAQLGETLAQAAGRPVPVPASSGPEASRGAMA
jgi:glycosyltransferase involved in cell wall biosynthesis